VATIDVAEEEHDSAMSDDERFYWCQRHERVERQGETCPEGQLLGPYPSADAARDWKRQHEAREERWGAQDDVWEGE
jgi:hypothetical protein